MKEFNNIPEGRRTELPLHGTKASSAWHGTKASSRLGCGSCTGILRGPTGLHDTIYCLTCRQLGHAEIVRGLQVDPRLCIRAEVPRQT